VQIVYGASLTIKSKQCKLLNYSSNLRASSLVVNMLRYQYMTLESHYAPAGCV